MPTGFASIPFAGFVFAVFVALFVAVGFVERSLVINFLVIVVFWSSICLLHVMNPGSASGQRQRILDGLMQIALIAVVHSAIQLTISWAISKVLKAK